MEKQNLKSVFLVFTLLVTLGVSAQRFMPDSVGQKLVTITLKAKYHAIIYALMPDKGSPDAINYVNQVRAAEGNRTTFDTSLNISVSVPYSMVAAMFYQVGSQPERLMAVDNAAIQDALIPQLYTPQYMDLLQVISAIRTQNGAETEQLRKLGGDSIMQIQLQ